MTRSIHRLNALVINRAANRGYYADGGGLYLQVSGSGTKSWIFRYCTAGRTRDMGLGSLDDFMLAEARERARECRQSLAKGIDPIDARRTITVQARIEQATTATFKECAEKYMAAHQTGWKNEKHRDQWHSTLATYAYPIIGDLPVASIDTALVMKVLEQEDGTPPVTLWAAKPETASRLRGRIESVIDSATARGFRTGENPARWKGHLRMLLALRGRHGKRHQPALPFAELPAFMEDLRGRPGSAARALELLILTAVRMGDLAGVKRHEFDLSTKVWTICAERTKGRRDGDQEHRVPLSARAIAIVSSLPVDGDFLFPGNRAGRPLSSAAIECVLDRMNASRAEQGLPRYIDPKQQGRDAVPHGFRSTFRDWAAERTNFPRDVAEMALAHTIDNKVEAAYRRGELFDKRRRLMDAWAAYATAPTKGQVIELRQRHAG